MKMTAIQRTDRIIRKAILFQGIREADFNDLLDTLDTQLKHYRSRQIVLKEGSPLYRMGLLINGTLSVQSVSYWNEKTTLETIHPGNIFAEDIAETRGAIADVRIEAETAAIVLWIGLNELFNLDGTQRWHTTIIRNMLNEFAHRNLLLSKREHVLTQADMRAKILSYLTYESRRQHRSSFTIPYDRRQLAQYLSVDRSAMSRQISELAKEGWFTTDRSHFTLHKMPKGR